MKALSIRQPWAWLICAGFNDIENRDWHIHMPPLLNYPKKSMRIYIHASKTSDVETIGNGCDNEQWILERLTPPQRNSYLKANYTRGAIIGEVDITGCVDESPSLWFVGIYGFTLANPVLYDKPIPCKGKLGFFEPELKK